MGVDAPRPPPQIGNGGRGRRTHGRERGGFSQVAHGTCFPDVLNPPAEPISGRSLAEPFIKMKKELSKTRAKEEKR